MNPVSLISGQRRELAFTSPLPPEECARRLAQVAQRPDSPSPLRPAAPGIYGTLAGPQFTLWYRPAYRNSWGTLFRGRLEASGSGTLIRGSFGAHPAVAVFMALWLGFALFLALVAAVIGAGRGGASWLLLVIPALMLGFGAALFGGFLWLGRQQQPQIIEFIQITLKAASATPPPSTS